VGAGSVARRASTPAPRTRPTAKTRSR
jgi:hypothetical protein